MGSTPNDSLTLFGQVAVLWTVRLAIAFYAARLWIDVRYGRAGIEAKAAKVARYFWTLGAALFASHVVAAFAVVHDWSHSAAWEATAEQTESLVGIDSGAGLHANYLFTVVWFVDVIAWWLADPVAPYRSRLRFWGVHSFFAFMVFNATVVFGPPFWRITFAPFFAFMSQAWYARKNSSANR